MKISNLCFVLFTWLVSASLPGPCRGRLGGPDGELPYHSQQNVDATPALSSKSSSLLPPKKDGSKQPVDGGTCVLVLEEMEMENEEDRIPPVWKCEIQDIDDTARISTSIFLDIDNPEEFVVGGYKIKSGITTLRIADTQVMSGGTKLHLSSTLSLGEVPAPAPAPFVTPEGGSSYELQAAGIKRVLVVRINANGASTSASRTTLNREIFGTNNRDVINLKERYASCSYNTLRMEPAIGNSLIQNGVVEVTISNRVAGSSHGVIREAAIRATRSLLGNLQDQFDHVMFCLPPGTNGNWVAYAGVNGWYSVYNDNWCLYPSAQVHEIGHNLGLAHSNQGSVEYGDQSGLMGFSYSHDEGPIMCFNPAKSWKLGWYSDRRTSMDPLAITGQSFSTNLVGINDYATSSSSTRVHIKLEDHNGRDFYIGYNKAAGINSGTVEAANRVTIQRKDVASSSYGASYLVAILASNQQYTISNYRNSGADVTIRVGNIPSISSTAGVPITITNSNSNNNNNNNDNNFNNDPEYFPIAVKRSGKCLDHQGSTFSGGGVHMWECHGGPQTQWYYNTNTQQLISPHGFCLDAAPPHQNGGLVHMWQCNSNNPNQRWQYNANTKTLKNHGYCLDADSGTVYNNGGRVHLWSCHGGTNQQWYMGTTSGAYKATLCRNSDCQGGSYVASFGNWNSMPGEIGNDELSRVFIGNNVAFWYYENSNYGGFTRTVGPDVDLNMGGHNDKVSSFRVRLIPDGQVMLCRNDNCIGGQYTAYRPGVWKTMPDSIGNDQLTRVQISRGWTFTYYEHNNLGGFSATYGSCDHAVNLHMNGHNDAVSSFRIALAC